MILTLASCRGCDADENLGATIRSMANHGRRFALAGGVTLADQQRECFFASCVSAFRTWCRCTSGCTRRTPMALCSGDPHAVGRRIRELCQRYGISDRMPRPIIPGDKRR